MSFYDEFAFSPRMGFEDGIEVVRQCTKCGQFIGRDDIHVFVNGLEEIRVDAACPKCGPFRAVWECL